MNSEQQARVYENFLHDTLQILYERALDQPYQQSMVSNVKDSFASGRKLAYYEVLSIIKHQAESFEISLDQIFKFDLDELLKI